MGNYSKAIAALVGLIVLFIGPDGFGLTTEDQATTLGNAVISILTVLSVYYLPNKQPE